jgi:hypothetical protein
MGNASTHCFADSVYQSFSPSGVVYGTSAMLKRSASKSDPATVEAEARKRRRVVRSINDFSNRAVHGA